MIPTDRIPLSAATFSAVYDELRKVARTLNRGNMDATLNPTALVHEAFLKLAGAKDLQIQSPEHLKYTATRAMKHLLLDAARRKAADIRGGGENPLRRVELNDQAAQSVAVDPRELLAVGAALDELALNNDVQARVFELQFFGGLQIAEIAELTGFSQKKVQRMLRLARASLALSMSRAGKVGTANNEL